MPGAGACPTPVKATLADGFEALLAMLTEPVVAPAEEGENATVSVFDAPAARVSGNVAPLTLYPVPLAVAEFTVIEAEDELFVRLKVWFVLLPTVTVPKSRDVGETTNAPGAGDCPTPVKATLADGFAALLAILIEPDAVPALDGEYVTVSVCDAPPARLSGKVAPLTLYPVPLAVAELTLIAMDGELFDNVTVSDFVDPVVTVPKSKLVVDRLSDAGASPLPITASVVGALLALLANVMLPETAPAVAGLKTTFSEADPLSAMVRGKVTPVILNAGSGSDTDDTLIFCTEELFVRTIFWLELAPVSTLPKSIEVFESVRLPGGGAIPSPDIVTAGSESVAVLCTASDPLATPLAAGANLTDSVSCEPPVIVRGNVLPVTEKPGPLTPAACTVTSVLPLFVSVRFFVALDPMVTLPNLMELAENARAADDGVPLGAAGNPPQPTKMSRGSNPRIA